MRLLLTGGSGFVGRHLCQQALARGFDVANLGRAPVGVSGIQHIEINDFMEKAAVAFGPTHILHAAASFDNTNVSQLVEANFHLPARLLELAARLSASFFRLGSYWEYGDADTPGIPIDTYAASKAALEPLMAYHGTYSGIACTSIFLYGTYGGQDKRGKLLDHLLDSAKAGRSVDLSPGEQILNLVHVDDVCSAILEELWSSSSTGTRQVAVFSNESFTVRELVELVRTIHPLDVKFGARPYRTQELFNPRYIHPNVISDNPIKLRDYISWRLKS